MKTTIYLLLAVFGYILSSCTEENLEASITEKMLRLTNDEVLSISYDDTKELSNNEIYKMISSFANAENTTTRNSTMTFKITKETYVNKEGEFKEIEKATRSIDNDGITSKICEVEFQNGPVTGRAIVAANANLPSIIAFIPNCSGDEMMELTGASKLLHASKASYLYKAIKMKELVDSLRNPTLEKISRELDLPIGEISYEKIKNNITLVDGGQTTRVTAIDPATLTVQILKSSIKPLVTTNWGQWDPYNGAFRDAGLVDWIVEEDGRMNHGPVLAGCVNIALAQMFTFTHRRTPLVLPRPAGVNIAGTFSPDFDLMTRKPKLDDSGMTYTGLQHAQWLILDLYKMNKTTSKKNSANYVTESEVAEKNMLATMSKYFKFDKKDSFNGDNAWAALRNDNLVLMLAPGHVFIISGILITEMATSTRQLVKTNDVYWHANLGWANECTGYYQLDHNANTYFEAGSVNQWCYKMEYINNIQANY